VKVTTERLEGSRVGFDMVFEPAEVDKAMDKVYRRLVNKVNVPGFRPGKAPRYMVERVIGRDTMLEEALGDIMPDALKQALDENSDLKLLGEPEPEVQNLDPLTVRLVMQVMPQVELPADYRSIRVPAAPVEVSDAEVTRAIGQLQSQQTKWSFPETERTAQLGDRAHVDIQGFTGEGPLSSKVQHDVLDLIPIEEGGSILPDLLDGIVGMKTGEEKDIATTFPEDYGDERLRGADVTFHVKLVEIQQGERPSLDDVAKAEGLADAEALRERIREQLTKEREERARSEQLDAMLRELNDRVDVALPQALVQDGVERRVKELEERLSRQKIKLSQYLGYLGKSRSDLEEEMRPEVERDTRTSLLIEQFAKREGLSVKEAEVRAEAERSIEAMIKSTLEQQEAEDEASAPPVADEVGDLDIEQTDTLLDAIAATPASSNEEAEATRQQRVAEVRQRLEPMLKNEDFLTSVATRMLNRGIEDRLLAIANGEQLPEPSADGDKAEASASGSDVTRDIEAEDTPLTPDELAEQQQTAGAIEVDGAREAPAESESPPLNPFNAPTSAQTDRAKEKNDL
jgi:trigger factor